MANNHPHQFGKVAVLFGGNSAERAVSLNSGAAVYEALKSQNIDVVKIDTKENLIAQLDQNDVDVAFIALHGIGGEDGTIQGLLEFYGLPYTGSGVKASAICMDKWRTKLIWLGLNLPTPNFVLAQAINELESFACDVGYPLMVKPALEGSSIGISKVKGENNWALLLDTDGFITEGTGDNFFLIKDGKVYTPEGRNILRGISRDYIFKLCDELNIECIEKNLETYDVHNADEAFVTATPFCLLPVTSLNGLKIGDKVMGKITKKIIDKWSSNVGVDIIAQIKDYFKEVDLINNNSPTPYAFKK